MNHIQTMLTLHNFCTTMLEINEQGAVNKKSLTTHQRLHKCGRTRCPEGRSTHEGAKELKPKSEKTWPLSSPSVHSMSVGPESPIIRYTLPLLDRAHSWTNLGPTNMWQLLIYNISHAHTFTTLCVLLQPEECPMLRLIFQYLGSLIFCLIGTSLPYYDEIL